MRWAVGGHCMQEKLSGCPLVEMISAKNDFSRSKLWYPNYEYFNLSVRITESNFRRPFQIPNFTFMLSIATLIHRFASYLQHSRYIYFPAVADAVCFRIQYFAESIRCVYACVCVCMRANVMWPSSWFSCQLIIIICISSIIIIFNMDPEYGIYYWLLLCVCVRNWTPKKRTNKKKKALPKKLAEAPNELVDPRPWFLCEIFLCEQKIAWEQKRLCHDIQKCRNGGGRTFVEGGWAEG